MESSQPSVSQPNAVELSATQTLNMDVLHLVHKIDRAAVEINKMETANVAEIGKDDLKDAIDLMEDFKLRLAQVAVEPKTRVGESHGVRVYDAGPQPVLPRRENDNLNYIVAFWIELRDIALNSESTRLGSSIQAKCKSKYKSITDKHDQFVQEYLQSEDRPVLSFTESAPSQANVGPGSRGAGGIGSH